MIYIFRHGKPIMPGPGKYCIGTTDLPLSAQGKFQAGLLGLFAREKKITKIYSSTLARSVDTARFMGVENVTKLTGLSEISMGAWDGLSFDDIRTKFPEEYKRRGEDFVNNYPTDAEPPIDALHRFEAHLLKLCSQKHGDFAIVGHAGITRLLICSISNIPLKLAFEVKLPYSCITELDVSHGLSTRSYGFLPKPALDRNSCFELHRLMQTPENIVSHCEAVCALSLEIGKQLEGIDLPALESAALLHDIARLEKNHASVAGSWLFDAGYLKISKIISAHHDLDWDGEQLDESAVLYIADKLVYGSDRVMLEERFASSLEKCKTAEARAAHETRLNTAADILSALKSLGIRI